MQAPIFSFKVEVVGAPFGEEQTESEKSCVVYCTKPVDNETVTETILEPEANVSLIVCSQIPVAIVVVTTGPEQSPTLG